MHIFEFKRDKSLSELIDLFLYSCFSFTTPWHVPAPYTLYLCEETNVKQLGLEIMQVI